MSILEFLLKFNIFLDFMMEFKVIKLWCVIIIFFGNLDELEENGRMVKFFFGFSLMIGELIFLFLLRILESDMYWLFFLMMIMWFVCSFFLVFFVWCINWWIVIIYFVLVFLSWLISFLFVKCGLIDVIMVLSWRIFKNIIVNLGMFGVKMVMILFFLIFFWFSVE